MKKYTLVKKALAVTMSCALMFQLAGCSKNNNENKRSVKIQNENGEDLVVIALVDVDGALIGNEMYGYIDKDFKFSSVTSDRTINLQVGGNTNCNVYYAKYMDCMPDDKKKDVNEVSLEELTAFENRAYVLNRTGAIKLLDDEREINMEKLNRYQYFKDDEEKAPVMTKQN